jgi:hypothetical protein
VGVGAGVWVCALELWLNWLRYIIGAYVF